MKKTLVCLSSWVSSLVVVLISVGPQLAEAQSKFKNPIAFPTIQDFLVAILNVVIVIATPIVVLFIIYAGFKYVTAQGKPEQIQEATKALTYAVIGGLVIISAVAIIKIIENLVKDFAA